MNVTYLGHACFSVVVGGKVLLFDPFISPNEKAAQAGISAETVEADYIFLSHGHEDHVADAEVIARRTGATLIANYEVGTWYAEKGLENVIPMNHGGTLGLPFGKVKMVNAVHSSVLPDGSYGGNPAGFVMESGEGNFYYSGDTALTYDMKLLAEFHDLDWAALCIGDHFTMGVKDAAVAAEWVGVQKVLGLHYDTFPPIEIDHTEAQAQFSEKGLDLLLPSVGETVQL